MRARQRDTPAPSSARRQASLAVTGRTSRSELGSRTHPAPQLGAQVGQPGGQRLRGARAEQRLQRREPRGAPGPPPTAPNRLGPAVSPPPPSAQAASSGRCCVRTGSVSRSSSPSSLRATPPTHRARPLPATLSSVHVLVEPALGSHSQQGSCALASPPF